MSSGFIAVKVELGKIISTEKRTPLELSMSNLSRVSSWNSKNKISSNHIWCALQRVHISGVKVIGDSHAFGAWNCLLSNGQGMCHLLFLHSTSQSTHHDRHKFLSALVQIFHQVVQLKYIHIAGQCISKFLQKILTQHPQSDLINSFGCIICSLLGSIFHIYSRREVGSSLELKKNIFFTKFEKRFIRSLLKLFKNFITGSRKVVEASFQNDGDSMILG